MLVLVPKDYKRLSLLFEFLIEHLSKLLGIEDYINSTRYRILFTPKLRSFIKPLTFNELIEKVPEGLIDVIQPSSYKDAQDNTIEEAVNNFAEFVKEVQKVEKYYKKKLLCCIDKESAYRAFKTEAISKKQAQTILNSGAVDVIGLLYLALYKDFLSSIVKVYFKNIKCGYIQ
jgi:hypothetical protein